MTRTEPLKGPIKMLDRQIYSEKQFRARIAQEWRRAERSGKPALLVLLDGLQSLPVERDRLVRSLSETLRETDVSGWFNSNRTFGVIFLEFGQTSFQHAREIVLSKMKNRVLSPPSLAEEIFLAAYALPPGPDDIDSDIDPRFDKALWKIIANPDRIQPRVLRVLDVGGAAALLIALSPVLLAISAIVRLTSPGPALFRQARTGMAFRTFSLLKFRTMRMGNDDKPHRDYVKQFINGNAKHKSDKNGRQVYKLTDDDRVTRVGKFLRRTSLDELPQLWNVLRGDMSMVGPRPPIPYEVECYDLWHRKRVGELKPGLTGLWQVRGRSRCNFDEMVRMDIQHTRNRSLGLYFSVLLQTPWAVIRGCGAH